MSNFWDTWGFIICVIIGLVVVIGGFALLDYAVNAHTCIAKTAEIGFPSKYDFWSGCRIFVDDRWIPLENWYFKTQ